MQIQEYSKTELYVLSPATVKDDKANDCTTLALYCNLQHFTAKKIATCKSTARLCLGNWKQAEPCRV
jgi:hypothetical protein